jgi:predicted Ser/Thr protein kinase
MTESSRADDRGQPAGALDQRVLEVRLAMQTAWSRGDRRTVEHFLEDDPELCGNADAALDCIYGEYVLREELGERPDPEEYCRRFPHFAEALRRLFAVDQALVGDGSQSTDPRDRATLPSATDPLPVPSRPMSPGVPASIGKYRVVSALDAGGQGLVFRAVHPTLGQDVVVKLARHPVEPGQKQHSLLDEGRLLAGLDHPHLARVYDLDFHDDRPFLVMEFIRGRTLEQFATEQRPTPARAAALVAQAARALAVAHQRGVTHRDLKPQNILVDEGGRARVIDFGLAQCRDAYQDTADPAGTIAGTVPYMAPEQARGDTHGIGPHTDVYALGAVLFSLLTERPPVEGRSLTEVLGKVGAGVVNLELLRRAGVPRRLEAVCRRALNADPQRRPTAAELADELDAACRRRWTAGYAALVAGAVLLATVGVWWAVQHGSAGAPGEPSGGPPVATPPAPAPKPGPPFAYADTVPTLFLRVSDEPDSAGPLTSRLPILTGYRLQVTVKPPPGVHVTLFLLSGTARKELAQRKPTASVVPLYFPSEEGTFVTLKGADSTECWLVCGNRSGAVTLAELEKWLPPGPAWPPLPERAVWRLLRPKVVNDTGLPRDIGEVVRQADAEGVVVRRLEELRAALAPHVDYFEAVAFRLKKAED